ncbi:MAG: GreA/GreB family elongation factor [Planctomycetaceae bacterium]
MKILTSSPIAQVMMGKKIGDVVEAEIPKGTLKMEITAIADPEE